VKAGERTVADLPEMNDADPGAESRRRIRSEPLDVLVVNCFALSTDANKLHQVK